MTPSVGCGSMGMETPCPPVPQAMPVASPTCGTGSMGGTPCVTIDTGCVQIGSQPSGGAPCPAPTQGMAPGGCPDMGTGAMPGSTCVIQGKLTVGCPNVTTGGNPCPLPGNITGGNIIPGPSGITNGSTNAKAPGAGPGLLPSSKSVPGKTSLTTNVKFIGKEFFHAHEYLNQITQSGHREHFEYYVQDINHFEYKTIMNSYTQHTSSNKVMYNLFSPNCRMQGKGGCCIYH